MLNPIKRQQILPPSKFAVDKWLIGIIINKFQPHQPYIGIISYQFINVKRFQKI